MRSRSSCSARGSGAGEALEDAARKVGERAQRLGHLLSRVDGRLEIVVHGGVGSSSNVGWPASSCMRIPPVPTTLSGGRDVRGDVRSGFWTFWPRAFSVSHAAEDLFEREEGLELRRFAEAAAVDGAGYFTKSRAPGGRWYRPSRKRPSMVLRAIGSGSGTAVPPVSRIATFNGTAPGPVTLKMPRIPVSSVRPMASARSSSWMNCTIGLKPMMVGT